MAGDVGTGITIAFGTSGFTASILSVNHQAITRAVRDVTHMGTTGLREKIFGDLYDAGTVQFDFLFDPDSQPPINAAAETITITFPLPAGGITPATLAGTGSISSWQFTGPIEEEMTAQAEITWDGFTGPTWTAST